MIWRRSQRLCAPRLEAMALEPRTKRKVDRQGADRCRPGTLPKGRFITSADWQKLVNRKPDNPPGSSTSRCSSASRELLSLRSRKTPPTMNGRRQPAVKVSNMTTTRPFALRCSLPDLALPKDANRERRTGAASAYVIPRSQLKGVHPEGLRPVPSGVYRGSIDGGPEGRRRRHRLHRGGDPLAWRLEQHQAKGV